MKNVNPVSLAPVIRKMDELFEVLNERVFVSTLTKPVITVEKGSRRSNSVYHTLGWCSLKEVWGNGEEKFYEINICPEFINRPIEEICATLLHEMCHLYNALNGIRDVSSNSQYHSKKFKACAEKHGLNVEKDSVRGFSITTLKPETLEFIKTLELVNFDLYRSGAEEDSDSMCGEEKQKKSSTRKYKCPCGKSFRATMNIDVICKKCNQDFVLVEKTQSGGA